MLSILITEVAVNKYAPLADHLKAQVGDSVELTFAQIDHLVGGLPPAAYNYAAWWANSRTEDSHNWAHQWIEAGWECKRLDRVNERVVFQRIDPNPLEPARNYWWVNHKQTFKSEFDGGYIWSPKVSTNGARNTTYNNLTLVQPGDVVVSYASGLIKAVGVATHAHCEALKPEEFGKTGDNWAGSGWMVPIEWAALTHPISPKEHIGKIEDLLPERNSPLQKNGNGNQGCYLAAISTRLGQQIVELASLACRDVIDTIDDIERSIKADQAEVEIQEAENVSATEKDQLIRSRRGQGTFRQRVLLNEMKCRLSGVDDQSFLVASHIKPWKDSDNTERLSGDNGLMLAPHVDKLFDRGWLSFEGNGDVKYVVHAKAVIAAWGLDEIKNVGPFTKEQQVFLNYHRAFVFKA